MNFRTQSLYDDLYCVMYTSLHRLEAHLNFILGPSLVMGQSLSSGNNSSSSSSPGRQSEVTIMLQDKPVGAKVQSSI